MTTPDRAHWQRWHDAYADPVSALSQRLRAVQRRIVAAVEAAPPGEVTVVSACAGQGHDLAGALTGHPRAPDVRGRLVELDPSNAAAARVRVADAGLTGVEVLTTDAGLSDSYIGAVPADLVLLCGVFGNVPDADVERTVQHAGQLCSAGATLIWTRHRRAPDLTPAIRGWFRDNGFEEIGFDSPDDASFAVGTARFSGRPSPLPPGLRLFAFDDA
jgi:hypothetical protein